MEFDIGRIPNYGFNFDISANADLFKISKDDCVLEEAVSVKGELKLLKKEVYFKGKTKSELRLACSRCLISFQFPVETEVFARYIPKPSANEFEIERQVLEKDINTEYYSNSKINLTESVRDAILLAVPMNQLCIKGCRGLCSQCGLNLNESECKCGDDADIDPRFEKLKQLRDKLQE
jgi:uncharacterized protein